MPRERMWHDNSFWVPLILEGKDVKGTFVIGEDDKVVEYKLSEGNYF